MGWNMFMARNGAETVWNRTDQNILLVYIIIYRQSEMGEKMWTGKETC